MKMRQSLAEWERAFVKEISLDRRRRDELLQTAEQRTLKRRAQRPERRAPRIGRLRTEFFLDTQELIVFRRAVGARQRAGFDLAAIGGDSEVGDGGVFRLAGAMRHHCRVSGLMRHFDRGQCFGQRADLIHLDENRVRHTLIDALLQPHRVGDE